MAWTTKQISDLDNSMVAAQNVSLGTTLNSYVITNKIASGSVAISAAVQDISTGLTSVKSAMVSLSGSPTLQHMFSTVIAGSTAGMITVSSWKPTNASTVTPIAATGSYVAVNWIAIGS